SETESTSPQALGAPDGLGKPCGPETQGGARCHAQVRLGPDGAPLVTSGPTGLGPAALQSAYVLPSSTAGVGVTVAVVDAFDYPNAESDLAVYRSTFGLPPCTTANGCFKKVN